MSTAGVTPCRARVVLRRLAAAVLVGVLLGELVRRFRQVPPGRRRGIWYRVRGRQPDPDVDDLVLADRVRSTLGPLHVSLDVPHVHVMVEDHVVILHGAVRWPHQAAAFVRAAGRVSGVRGVESYLHVGLGAGDTVPSEAGERPQPPSPARRRLRAAALAVGASELHADAVVRATLAALAERVPAGERAHVRAHLPSDVRAMLAPSRRTGDRSVDSVDELVSAVAAGVDEDARSDVTTAAVANVVAELGHLVPDETDDVASTLPPALRALWSTPA